MAEPKHPVEAVCHCGAISITVPREPDHINECKCTICRRYAAAWSYYKSTEIEIKEKGGGTKIYLWGDRMIEFHFCQNCGCVCYWWGIVAEPDGTHEVGVNSRNMDPEALKHVDWKISNSWLMQPVQDKATAHRDDKASY